MVGEHADIRGDMQRLFGDFVRGKIGVLLEGARGGHRIVAAGTDGRNAVVRLDNLARAGDDHQRFAAGDNQHRFQLTHGLVAAPFLRQLNGGALQIAGKLFQLGFKVRRTLCAVALKMVLSPIVTWPSPATAILPSFLTAQMVVPLSVIYVYLRYDTLGYVAALPRTPAGTWNVIHCIPHSGRSFRSRTSLLKLLRNLFD